MSQALLPGMVALPDYGDANDFYSTPPSAVEAVLPFIPRLKSARWNVLEPAAGEGAVLKALLPHIAGTWPRVIGPIPEAWAYEISAQRTKVLVDNLGTFLPMTAVQCCDFLTVPLAAFRYHSFGRPWLAMLNPPYSKPYEGIGLDFVERCLEIAEQETGSVVAGLLPLDFATGVDRCKRVHDRWKGSLYPLRRRQDFGGPHGSGQRPVAWFIWDISNPKNEYQVIG